MQTHVVLPRGNLHHFESALALVAETGTFSYYFFHLINYY